jgi:hypothetical protein
MILIEHTRAAALALMLAATTAVGAQAQPTETEPLVLSERKADDADIFAFDFGVPSSPALSLAGLSPDKTTTSTSLKPFVISLLPALGGEAENLSVALDFAPAAYFWDQRSYAHYRNATFWQQIVARSRLGLATYGGVTDEDPAKAKSSKVAFGYSVSLLSDSDPFFAKLSRGDAEPVWLRCIKQADAKHGATARAITAERTAAGQAVDRLSLATYILDLPNPTPERLAAAIEARRGELGALFAHLGMAMPATPHDVVAALRSNRARLEQEASTTVAASNVVLAEKAVKEGFTKAIDDCAKLANMVAQSSQDLDLGFGALWNGAPGDYSDLKGGGVAAWAAYKFPFRVTRNAAGAPERSWIVGGSARYATKERVATGDAAQPEFEASTFDAWIGLEVITEESKFALQHGWFDAQAEDNAFGAFSQSGSRWLGSAAFRLGGERSPYWVKLSYGAAEGTTDARNDETLLFTLHIAPPKDPGLFSPD